MLLDKDDGTYSVFDIIDRFEEGDIKANFKEHTVFEE
jgi:hypothetical protein